MDAVRRLARLLASGFGVGRVPFAPGTAGSAAAVLVGAGLLRRGRGALVAGVVGAVLGGIWAVRESGGAEADPGWVVIDEVAGQWITLLGLREPTPLGLLAAFALFRALDIAKPGPVGWADRKGGAGGVMADDVIAGALGAALLWGLRANGRGCSCEAPGVTPSLYGRGQGEGRLRLSRSRSRLQGPRARRRARR